MSKSLYDDCSAFVAGQNKLKEFQIFRQKVLAKDGISLNIVRTEANDTVCLLPSAISAAVLDLISNRLDAANEHGKKAIKQHFPDTEEK